MRERRQLSGGANPARGCLYRKLLGLEAAFHAGAKPPAFTPRSALDVSSLRVLAAPETPSSNAQVGGG
jgi:hypothetical protein